MNTIRFLTLLFSFLQPPLLFASLPTKDSLRPSFISIQKAFQKKRPLTLKQEPLATISTLLQQIKRYISNHTFDTGVKETLQTAASDIHNIFNQIVTVIQSTDVSHNLKDLSSIEQELRLLQSSFYPSISVKKNFGSYTLTTNPMQARDIIEYVIGALLGITKEISEYSERRLGVSESGYQEWQRAQIAQRHGYDVEVTKQPNRMLDQAYSERQARETALSEHATRARENIVGKMNVSAKPAQKAHALIQYQAFEKSQEEKKLLQEFKIMTNMLVTRIKTQSALIATLLNEVNGSFRWSILPSRDLISKLQFALAPLQRDVAHFKNDPLYNRLKGQPSLNETNTLLAHITTMMQNAEKTLTHYTRLHNTYINSMLPLIQDIQKQTGQLEKLLNNQSSLFDQARENFASLVGRDLKTDTMTLALSTLNKTIEQLQTIKEYKLLSQQPEMLETIESAKRAISKSNTIIQHKQALQKVEQERRAYEHEEKRVQDIMTRIDQAQENLSDIFKRYQEEIRKTQSQHDQQNVDELFDHAAIVAAHSRGTGDLNAMHVAFRQKLSQAQVVLNEITKFHTQDQDMMREFNQKKQTLSQLVQRVTQFLISEVEAATTALETALQEYSKTQEQSSEQAAAQQSSFLKNLANNMISAFSAPPKNIKIINQIRRSAENLKLLMIQMEDTLRQERQDSLITQAYRALEKANAVTRPFDSDTSFSAP